MTEAGAITRIVSKLVRITAVSPAAIEEARTMTAAEGPQQSEASVLLSLLKAILVGNTTYANAAPLATGPVACAALFPMCQALDSIHQAVSAMAFVEQMFTQGVACHDNRLTPSVVGALARLRKILPPDFETLSILRGGASWGTPTVVLKAWWKKYARLTTNSACGDGV